MDARPTKAPDFPALKQRIVAALGNKGVVSDPQEVAPYLAEQRRRYKGTTPFVIRSASPEEVATAVTLCPAAALAIVPQCCNTVRVAGAPPSNRSATRGEHEWVRVTILTT